MMQNMQILDMCRYKLTVKFGKLYVTSNIKLMPYLNTGLDVDGGDLLHNLGGGMQVNHPLVNPSKKKNVSFSATSTEK